MPQPFTTRPELRGTFGAIATTHWIASAAGMAVLERGGNAFDAAAAAGFVLQIVEPHLNGPGGEVPIILQRADADAPIVICGQGTYPAAATLARFVDFGLKQVPGTGLLPAVVPGAFDACMLLLRDHGTWRLRDVLDYAIHYAQNGFPVLPRIAASILAARTFFAEQWPTSAPLWCPNGAVPPPGSLLATPRIAARSQRSGTPVKSCSTMRATTNGISSVRGATAFQAASSRMWCSLTFLPSQLRSTDSSTRRIDTGSRSIRTLSALPSAGSE